MSDNFIEKIDHRTLHRFAFDEMEDRLYCRFRNTDGAFEGNYREFSRDILLGFYPCLENDSPKFLSIGRDTLIRRYFGNRWGNNPLTARRTLKPRFRSFVRGGYLHAYQTGEPVLELISTKIETTGETKKSVYRRLILPTYSGKSGNRLTITYCSEVET